MSAGRSQVFTARWVLPVTSPVIEHGAVYVDQDGRIAALGPASTLQLPDVPRHDLGEAALLPGLAALKAGDVRLASLTSKETLST